MATQNKRNRLDVFLICSLIPTLISGTSISTTEIVSTTLEELVTATTQENSGILSQHLNSIIEQSLSINLAAPVEANLTEILSQIPVNLNPNSFEEPCPLNNSYCVCIGELYHRVCCENISDPKILEDVMSSLTAKTVVVELGSLNLTYFPLEALNNPYLLSLIISNSNFRMLFNTSELSNVDSSGILYHLSLENVTTSEWSWNQFGVLRTLEILFFYNTTIGERITPALSQHINKSLKLLSIAETDISIIETDSFKNLRNLTYLRISNSKLTTLSRDIFPSPSKLEHLRLDHNLITLIHNGTFENMETLSLVSLSNNVITLLPEEVFRPLWRHNMNLELRNNPIKCDCRMRWTVMAPVRPHVVGTCAHPKRMFGREIRSLTEADFNCP